MTKETLKSITEDEIMHAGLTEADARTARLRVLRNINSIGNRGLVSLPGEGEVNPDVTVEAENSTDVRILVQETIAEVSRP